MASIGDISVSAAINLLSALTFLVAFGILRLQPFNDRVYFPKWYLKGIRGSPKGSTLVKKFVNLDLGTYIRFLNWMPAALHMPELELIDHAGLDSVVYVRIYILGWVVRQGSHWNFTCTDKNGFKETAISDLLFCFKCLILHIFYIFFSLMGTLVYRIKIFAPITVLAFMVLVPVNWTGKTLDTPNAKDLQFSSIDKISISNIPFGSNRWDDHYDSVVLALSFSLALTQCRFLTNWRGCWLCWNVIATFALLIKNQSTTKSFNKLN